MPKHKIITVADTPTLLYEALGPQAETVVLDVQSGSTITIGDQNVVAGAGPQYPVSSTPITLGPVNGDAFYAICPSGLTAHVDVLAFVSGNP